MSKIQIVFMGTPDFAEKILAAFIRDRDFEILAVFTQPDSPIGRQQILVSSSVKQLALAHNIPVFQPLRPQDIKKYMKDFAPDFLVTAAYGMILPKEILDIPKYFAVNVHASLLPKYRGASPIQSALLNGDRVTGITVLKMNEKLDAGDILAVREVKIGARDTARDLFDKLSDVAQEFLPEVLKRIRRGKIKAYAQDNFNATFCKKLSRGDGFLDFKKENARNLYNRFRAFYPWPGCFTEFNGRRLKILDAHFNENTSLAKGEWFLGKHIIKIGTIKGEFIPKVLQLEGKNPLKVSEFLRGLQN